MTTHIDAMIALNTKIRLLDHGYIHYIGHMGDDSSIIENARMSTGKGFFGWFWEKDTYADVQCRVCHVQHLFEELFYDDELDEKQCSNCWAPGPFIPQNEIPGGPKLKGKKNQPRDLSLLEFMYMNRHMSPYESGELCVEVYAPIMVFREWHRHRTESYNEFSARYAQMPNKHYVPSPDRIQKQSQTNKQGSGAALEISDAEGVCLELSREQYNIYKNYDTWVRGGLAKEIARINTPVSRYSKMRAKTDLRNWLGFLLLRMENGAQWEIRQYANALAWIVKQIWPKTFDLFIEHDFLGVRFSRSEMVALRKLIGAISRGFSTEEVREVTGFGEKKAEAFMQKVFRPKEDDYREVLTKLGY